jgi:hypothetical protein
MFRLLSRVVVVSVFALSLNFAVVPAAQARIQVSRQVSTADQGCVNKAMEWLNQVLGKEPKGSKKNLKKLTAQDGCTIDPLGHPRCP